MFTCFTQDQKDIYNGTVSFVHKNLNRDEDLEYFSYDAWASTAKYGLFGICASEEYGGLQESYSVAAAAMEALGYSCINNGFVFAITNHIWVGIQLIERFASSALKQKYLKKAIEGRSICAMAITEADAGSDAHAMKTTMTLKGDNYIINGSKMFVSNGTIADLFIVYGLVEVNEKLQMTAFIVEKQMKGVHVGKEIDKMGLKCCPMCEISFQECEVPKENILGSVGIGGLIMNTALELERCFEFAPHVGAMQRIMEKCYTYVNKRQQFGKCIADYQGISHKIAEMKVKIELAKSFLYKIAMIKDGGRSAYLEAAIFKLHVSEAYIQTCRDAMQIFGAYGYTVEYGIEREMRDALACSIYSGTNEIQKNTIFNMLCQ